MLETRSPSHGVARRAKPGPTRLKLSPPSFIERALARIAPKAATRHWVARNQFRILAQTSGYEGGRQTRLQKNRPSMGGSADSHVSDASLWRLRENCRNLERNNPLAAGILGTMTDSVIGTGFRPQAKSPDPEWNALAEQWWTETPMDSRGVMSNPEFQRTLFHSVIRDGDVGLILLDGQFQAIEADRIASPSRKPEGSKINLGIEMNATGYPLNYWVGSSSPFSSYVTDAKPIAASDFCHLYRPLRFSQTRGIPALSPIIDTLDRINDTAEAVIIAHQLAACQGLLVKQVTPEGLFPTPDVETNPATGKAEYVEEMEPGMVRYLEPGEDVVQVKPEHPSQQFETLMRVLSRFCGRHLGLPIELVLLDFSESNFSNTRAAILEARQMFRAWQIWWEYSFLRRAWRYRISWAIKHGELDPIENPWNVRWNPPSWPWIDPLKDIQADILAFQHNVVPRAKVCNKYGEDIEEVDALRARERESEPAVPKLAIPRPDQGEPPDAAA